VHFRVEQSIDAPRDGVTAALVDPAFYRELAALPDLGHPEVLDCHHHEDDVEVRVRYAFAGNLSAAVRAVVDPAKLTWVQETTVHPRRHRAQFRIVPDHYRDRLECAGSFALLERGERTHQVVEGDLVVHFPLVARAVERAIVSGLEENLAGQAEVLARLVMAETPRASDGRSR
jgi:hypothetical protein